ncbi:WD40 domain-containing protein [Almyronema epifaneia]|uniref:NB-ARC domain-containing protein n=1 Tax=Almyronema epifaneia S1 TaxID=2991925 RepID=A0ABW6ID44_9CYAN
MSRSPKRYRGVVLTQQGIDRLEVAIATAQDEEKYGKRFTQAELAERTDLSIKTIKKIRQRTAPVDETSVRTLFEAFGLELETADYGLPELPALVADQDSTIGERPLPAKIDWGEKPDTAIFFGRTEELATLGQWVMAEQCRVVTLLGMGGIGKTSLAAKLADQIYEQFDYVIWRSLREAPPLDEILVRLIQFLSDQQETEINLPNRLGERIIRLLHYLRSHRCLLVLDNLESILQAESTGQFRDGYEGYGELIRRIGEAEHQSCLLLTSRECPRELAPMAGDRLSVRLWSVTGIDTDAGREILKAKGLDLEDTDTQGQELIRRYSGNPQALHLVATAIQREFLGDVDDFLEEEGAAVEDVRSLLDQHLTRLAPLERSILFWLAINREPVGLDELMEDLLPPVTKREVRSALRGLSDRYLIETVDKQFTLQNVIMEFATDRFVGQVFKELNTQKFDLFHTHALIKATVKNYVRETQIRLILRALLSRIEVLDQKIHQSLETIRQSQNLPTGYAPGNLINILCQTQCKVHKIDFSGFTFRQAHLKGMTIRDLNLENVLFIQSSLTQVFSRIAAIAFSPDGKLIASGDGNGNVQFWKIEDQKIVTALGGHISWIHSLAFSPDGKYLASSSDDVTIRLWDVQQRKCLDIFKGHIDEIRSVAFSPDGKLLASGSDDSTIRLWNIQQRRCVCVLKGHTDWVCSVTFSPDGKYLASGSSDATIRLWDVHEQRCTHKLNGRGLCIWSIAFSPDGRYLATGHLDTTVRLWNIQQGRCINVFEGHTNWVRSVAFSSNSQLLASASGDATIRLWGIQERHCLHVFTAHEKRVRSVAFSPDGKFLASGSEDATIRLWNIQKRQCFHVFTGHTNWVRFGVFSPDGKYLASGSSDATIRFWNIQERKCTFVLEGHKNWVRSVAFSPDGKFLISGGDDATIRLWDIDQRKCVHTVVEKTNWVSSVAFSPDGKLVAHGSSKSTIRVWDAQNWQCLFLLKGHEKEVRGVAFSPNGKYIASSSDDLTVRLWCVEKKQCLHVFTGHTKRIWPVIFSPNGKLLVSGSEDATIRLWDIHERQILCVFEKHTNWIMSVAFSPDGNLLASSSGDSTIIIWDVRKRQYLYVLEGHTTLVESVAFSPDGKVLVSCDSDGSIRFWDVTTRNPIGLLQVPRPYEGTNTTRVRGLTDAQRNSLIALGTVDYSSEIH